MSIISDETRERFKRDECWTDDGVRMLAIVEGAEKRIAELEAENALLRATALTLYRAAIVRGLWEQSRDFAAAMSHCAELEAVK